MQAWAYVTLSGRPTVRFRLSDSTTLGASNHADIRMADESISDLHFLFKPQADGCWVELTDAATQPFSVDGKPMRRGVVAWGQELYFHKLRVLFQMEKEGKDSTSLSPAVWATIAIVIPLASALFYFSAPRPDDGRKRAESDIPKLFTAPPDCSDDGDGALERARIAEATAHAKHQRGVFELSDAVDSVQYVREASQCYFRAGRDLDAQRTADLGERWRSRLEFEYERTRLALDLARRHKKQKEIVERSRQLSILLRHAGEDAESYRLWLDGVTRTQRAQHALQAAQKKKRN